jgi:hypothetical protein
MRDAFGFIQDGLITDPGDSEHRPAKRMAHFKMSRVQTH